MKDKWDILISSTCCQSWLEAPTSDTWRGSSRARYVMVIPVVLCMAV